MLFHVTYRHNSEIFCTQIVANSKVQAIDFFLDDFPASVEVLAVDAD